MNICVFSIPGLYPLTPGTITTDRIATAAQVLKETRQSLGPVYVNGDDGESLFAGTVWNMCFQNNTTFHWDWNYWLLDMKSQPSDLFRMWFYMWTLKTCLSSEFSALVGALATHICTCLLLQDCFDNSWHFWQPNHERNSFDLFSKVVPVVRALNWIPKPPYNNSYPHLDPSQRLSLINLGILISKPYGWCLNCPSRFASVSKLSIKWFP